MENLQTMGLFSGKSIATADVTAGQREEHRSGNRKSRVLVLFLLYCLGQVIMGAVCSAVLTSVL